MFNMQCISGDLFSQDRKSPKMPGCKEDFPERQDFGKCWDGKRIVMDLASIGSFSFLPLM